MRPGTILYFTASYTIVFHTRIHPAGSVSLFHHRASVMPKMVLLCVTVFATNVAALRVFTGNIRGCTHASITVSRGACTYFPYMSAPPPEGYIWADESTWESPENTEFVENEEDTADFSFMAPPAGYECDDEEECVLPLEDEEE